MSRTLLRIFLVGLGILCLYIGSPNAQTSGVKIQLVFIMDGSGSIPMKDFKTMIEAIAKTVSDPNIVPQNGTIELGLVQFSANLRDPKTGIDGAFLEIPMTIITTQNANDVANRIKGIAQGAGFTPMFSGIKVATEQIKGDKARPGARQVFNIITDGNPNLPGGPEEAKAEALKARDEAVTAGLDQFDAEGIGDVEKEPEFRDFLLQLVWPQPGKLAPPFPPGHQNGFVVIAKTFADLESALRQKLVATINQPPVADPGPIPDGKPDTEPYRCNAGQTITLDGSGSHDPDGQIVKFEWDFNGDGTPDATGARVQFTCPSTPGSVTIKLTVTDSAGTTATAQQTIVVSQAPPPNQPPTAVCAQVGSVTIGQKVQLDGSGSSDPEGKPLTFQWSFVSKPADSQAVFDDATIAKPSFTPDKVGSYVARLTVRDPEGAAASCDVTVEARKPGEVIPGDELGNMKREIITLGRTLNFSKTLEALQLAANLFESFGATERTLEIVQETQLVVNELLDSLEDTRSLMAFLADGAENTHTRLEALVAANTISTERANRIHTSVDTFSDFVEGSEGRLDAIEDLLNEALEILADIEDSLSLAGFLSVPQAAGEMSVADMLRSARDKLLIAFAGWRAVLNSAIAHIDKISAQLRAALKLAERRNRFRLVRPENFIELRAAEHRIQFAPSAARWSVQGCGGCSLKVEVYALDGRRLIEQESPGPTLALRWPHTPANGLYWYVLTIEAPGGQTVRLLGKWAHVR